MNTLNPIISHHAEDLMMRVQFPIACATIKLIALLYLTARIRVYSLCVTHTTRQCTIGLKMNHSHSSIELRSIFSGIPCCDIEDLRRVRSPDLRQSMPVSWTSSFLRLKPAVSVVDFEAGAPSQASASVLQVSSACRLCYQHLLENFCGIGHWSSKRMRLVLNISCWSLLWVTILASACARVYDSWSMRSVCAVKSLFAITQAVQNPQNAIASCATAYMSPANSSVIVLSSVDARNPYTCTVTDSQCIPQLSGHLRVFCPGMCP